MPLPAGCHGCRPAAEQGLGLVGPLLPLQPGGRQPARRAARPPPLGHGRSRWQCCCRRRPSPSRQNTPRSWPFRTGEGVPLTFLSPVRFALRATPLPAVGFARGVGVALRSRCAAAPRHTPRGQRKPRRSRRPAKSIANRCTAGRCPRHCWAGRAEGPPSRCYGLRPTGPLTRCARCLRPRTAGHRPALWRRPATPA